MNARSRKIAAALVMLAAMCAALGAASAAKPPSIAASSADEVRITLERGRLMLEESKAKQDQINEATRSQFEREKLRLEQEKVSIERDKAEIEREKAMWTAIASIVPLAAVLLTVAFGVWSSTQQMRIQTLSQIDAAKLAFEMKAAEIAFAAKTPEGVLNRGKVLKAMFGTRLPGSFLQSFVPRDVVGESEPAQEKLVLMGHLAEHIADGDKILAYWQKLFPGDKEWLRRLLEPSATEPARVAESERHVS